MVLSSYDFKDVSLEAVNSAIDKSVRECTGDRDEIVDRVHEETGLDKGLLNWIIA